MTLNTTNAIDSKVDIDSNCPFITLCGIAGDVAPSHVEWTFPLSGNSTVFVATPSRFVEFIGAQYIGDIYGGGIGNYKFPGIDVLVSRYGIGSVEGPIWELENYDFAAGTTSSLAELKRILRKEIGLMISEATHRGSLRYALRENINTAVKPDGEIFYVDGDQYIAPGSGTNFGEGRRTIIVNGNVTLGANLIKTSDEWPALIIALGEVTITEGNKTIELGILSPGIRDRNGNPTEGRITIINAPGYLDFEGFLIGARVDLRDPILADSQSIRYDESLIFYPPPGLSKLSLPIFKEVAP